MKTNTKIFATFGIVAGLGIASLPVFSYATDVSGDIQIDAEITPAIAMRIHSNADVNCADTQDSSTCADTYGVIKYNPATTQSTGEPNSVDGPSLATGLELSANQKDLTTLYSDVEVRSNTGKFQLTLADNDTDTRLNLSPASTEQNQYIETADGEPEAASASWAVRGGDIDEWSAMPASDADPLTILNNGINATSPLDFSSVATVNYGVSSGQSKTGTYSDVVTYTATAMDSSYRGLTYTDEYSINNQAAGNNINVSAGTASIRAVVPTPGYYLDRVECSDGYACEAENTGVTATNEQNITITNSNPSVESGVVSVIYKYITPSSQSTPAFYTISTMQEMTHDICKDSRVVTPSAEATGEITKSNWKTATEGVPTIRLSDSRGGVTEVYTVKKLSDGQCWMTENLRLPAGATITSDDSDLDGTIVRSYTLPENEEGDKIDTKVREKGPHAGEHVKDTYRHQVDKSGYKIGTYYSWYAAVAGTGYEDSEWGVGKYDMIDVYGTATNDGANAAASICPKGWRLPTAGKGSGVTNPTVPGTTDGIEPGDFYNLYTAYLINSDNAYSRFKYFAQEQYGPNLALGGHIDNYGRNMVNGTGRYWTSTSYNGVYGWYMYMTSYSGANGTGYVDPATGANNDKQYGYSVRCIAR